MESQGAQIAKTIPKKNNKGHICPDFKTYYEATLVKIVWYRHKYRHLEQCNRIEAQK